MVDIHCHLLYGVDDGADTIEESAKMLYHAKEQGIEAIILTPHYRHGMFAYPKDAIASHFLELKPYAKELGIRLALGTEYHVNSQIVEALKGGRCQTLAGSRYVLSEYSHSSEYSYVYQMTQELILNGFIPVIAHVERYACMTEDIERADELRQLGAWIQMNADAVLGLEGRGSKKYAKRMIASGYVDVVASDSHGAKQRVCHMDECRAYLAKKFGADISDKLLRENPMTIIENR